MHEHEIAAAVLAGPDAILAADADGTITYWNAGAERIFGHTRDEAVGRSLDLIVPERLRDRHWAGWREVLRTGHSRYGDDDLLSVPSVRRDGTSISVEFTIHPVHDDGGAPTGFAATLRDVTARFEQLRDLRRKLAERESGRESERGSGGLTPG